MLQYLIPADIIIHIISRGVKKRLKVEVKRRRAKINDDPPALPGG